MHSRTAKADIKLLRQQTQYTCTAASLCAAYKALGKDLSETDVNKVLGSEPFQGASWEQMLAATQYFGMRGILVVPSTIQMLKNWTDKGIPVVIAWNPEKRPWSHASVVFDVLDDGTVYVMDPNIPDPSEMVRVVPQKEFYSLWAEKWSDQLIVRRPAMAIELEVSPEGRQVRASTKKAVDEALMDRASRLLWYMDQNEAIKHLMEEGVSKQDAYLAVKAGLLLNKRRGKNHMAAQTIRTAVTGGFPHWETRRLAVVDEIKSLKNNANMVGNGYLVRLDPKAEIAVSGLLERTADAWWQGDTHTVRQYVAKIAGDVQHLLPRGLWAFLDGDETYFKTPRSFIRMADEQHSPPMPHSHTLPEPELIQPTRQEGSPDPDAPGAFWWTEEIPAIVWRNHYFQTRFVMATRDKDHFILVPSDQVGQWGGSGYQVVSQPQNPRLAADWGKTLAERLE